MAKPQKPKDIDGYMAQFPADVQAILEKVRTTIRHAAPEAKETISYLMPTFKLHGILVYFAAWKHHIGLYPPVSGDKALERAVRRFAGPKSNLLFPLDEPIPYDLIERVVRLRVKQDSVKAAARRKKKKYGRSEGEEHPAYRQENPPDDRRESQRYLCALGRKRSPKAVKMPAPWYCPSCLKDKGQSTE